MYRKAGYIFQGKDTFPDSQSYRYKCILMYLDVSERNTSRYNQDTIRIHHDTSGYVSDRKLHPKTIGNPPSPGAGTHTGHTGAHEHTEDTDEPRNHPNPRNTENTS